MSRAGRRHYVARVDDTAACPHRLARRRVSCRRSGVLLLTRTLDLTPAEGIVLAHGEVVQARLGRQAVTAEVRACGCQRPTIHHYGGIAFKRHPWTRRAHYRLTFATPGAGEPLSDRCLRPLAAVMAALRGEPYGPGLLPELLVRGSVPVSHYPHQLAAAAREAYGLTIPSAYFLSWCRQEQHTWH